MKNTLLCSALLTLINSPLFAESMPTNTAATTTPTASTMNCDYKISASVKVVDQSTVLTWAEKATVQSFDFDPKDIDAQMKKLQSCFTKQGWDGFNTALEKSGNLNAIKANKLNVSSQVDGAIHVTDSQPNLWKMIVPLQVVYQNDKEKITQLLNIQLTVGRKPEGDLGILQMVATPRAPEARPATTRMPVQQKN